MRTWTLFALALISASCSLQTTLTLQPGGEADVTAVISLAEPAREAWQTLRDLDPTLPSDPFDPGLLKKSLGPQGRVVSSAGATRLDFRVADLKKYVPTWSTGPEVWEGTIDRETIRRWAGLSEWSESPAFGSLLPEPGTPIAEEDYRELLVYLLGPGVTEAAAQALVDVSTVQVTLVAPRAIASAPGSLSIAGRTAVYRWPLVRVLTLEQPIRIRLTF